MGKTNTRIYRVTISPSGELVVTSENKERLVRATSQAAAERYCFKDRVTAKRATQDDLEELLTEGVKVEDAGKED